MVDNWRFWITHLWVEGFFELFATVLAAVVFVQMGLVATKSATRLVYLDAILYLARGPSGDWASLVFHGPGAPPFLMIGAVPVTLAILLLIAPRKSGGDLS